MATGAVNESKLYSEYHIITKKALQNLALFERAVRNEHKLTYKRKQADRTIWVIMQEEKNAGKLWAVHTGLLFTVNWLQCKITNVSFFSTLTISWIPQHNFSFLLPYKPYTRSNSCHILNKTMVLKPMIQFMWYLPTKQWSPNHMVLKTQLIQSNPIQNFTRYSFLRAGRAVTQAKHYRPYGSQQT